MNKTEIFNKGQRRTFPLGQLVVTRGINDKIADDLKFSEFVLQSMRRHAAGDWGDLTKKDIEENENALEKGFRLLSAYIKEEHPKIWIITEADRSVTTVLFPTEY